MQLKSSLISFNHHFDSPVIPTRGVKPQGFTPLFLLGISDEVAVGGNKKVRFFCHKIRSYAYYS